MKGVIRKPVQIQISMSWSSIDLGVYLGIIIEDDLGVLKGRRLSCSASMVNFMFFSMELMFSVKFSMSYSCMTTNVSL